MRAVRGEVVLSKPVTLAKAARGRVFTLFAASEASGLPAEAGAFVLSAAEAAAELHAFRRSAREGESSEKLRKKRERNDTAV
ncbi:hypothetical protein BAE44_0009122 [Dichanthelium oligosanthes]|uniref:Uncharacterized protein n=1 Tax=Dichanthelium oligosanthes TaxID=888268 RepID=A0A1E5VXM5_9POAL|nr:hypothetical protein BAE44_0009122 [Dichanthelium oligosanthes]